jgi:hypothetical protein
MNKNKEKIRKIRKEMGLSCIVLAKMFDVNEKTVAGWVRDIKLTPEQLIVLRKNNNSERTGKLNSIKALEKRLEFQKIGAIRAINENDLLFKLGCMLYWAEGEKSKGVLRLVNTDPYMIKMFYKFLIESLLVEKTKVKITIIIHEGDDMQKAERFWQDWLGISDLNMMPTRVKKNYVNSVYRKNRHCNGICEVRICNTEKAQIVFGAIKKIAGIEDVNLWATNNYTNEYKQRIDN